MGKKPSRARYEKQNAKKTVVTPRLQASHGTIQSNPPASQLQRNAVEAPIQPTEGVRGQEQQRDLYGGHNKAGDLIMACGAKGSLRNQSRQEINMPKH
jgi:hypothetical protein